MIQPWEDYAQSEASKPWEDFSDASKEDKISEKESLLSKTGRAVKGILDIPEKVTKNAILPFSENIATQVAGGAGAVLAPAVAGRNYLTTLIATGSPEKAYESAKSGARETGELFGAIAENIPTTELGKKSSKYVAKGFNALLEPVGGIAREVVRVPLQSLESAGLPRVIAQPIEDIAQVGSEFAAFGGLMKGGGKVKNIVRDIYREKKGMPPEIPTAAQFEAAESKPSSYVQESSVLERAKTEFQKPEIQREYEDFLNDVKNKSRVSEEEMLEDLAKQEDIRTERKAWEEYERFPELPEGFKVESVPNRVFKDILEDINTAVGKKGAIGEWERSLESLAAKERLKEDLAKFSEAAKREGKDVVQYLKDIGVSDDVIVPFARLESELKKGGQSESIKPEVVIDVAALTKNETAITDSPVIDNVTQLVPKEIRKFRKNLKEDISAGVDDILNKVDEYSDWKFVEGDRVKSNKTGHVWEITNRSWNRKENRPTYYAKDLSEPGTSSLFNKGMEDAFVKISGKPTDTSVVDRSSYVPRQDAKSATEDVSKIDTTAEEKIDTGAKKSFLEYAKERGFELEDLQKDKETLYKLRVDYNKEMSKPSTTLYSDPFGFQASAKVLGKIVEDAKEGWDKVLEKYPTIEKLDEKTRSRVEEIYRGVKEGILDPERVMREDPYAMEVFKNLANAEEMKNAFMQKIMPVFFEATKGIKKGSDSSVRIGKVLDGQEGVEILTGKERKAYDFFKEHYDWMIHEYARNAAGSEVNYRKILNLVNNKQAKRSRIKDLNSEDRATYDKLRQIASEIKGENKISELDQTTRDAYERASQQARDLLHNDFKKSLSEGERAAYDILSKKLTDYLPHLFDKTELKEMFEADISRIKAKLEKATKKEVITKYKNQIEEIERAILNLEGGKWINFRDLPKDVFFRFFVERKGAKGYSFDAVKAFETYVYGIARKIYDEPALRKSYELYEKVDPSLKPYTKELVNHYMGYGEKSRFDNFARFITTFEWIRTLGLNPRSAIVNLTQRLNTAVWVGEKYAIQAQKMMFLDKAKADALFDKSGVAREVPQVLMEGPVAPSLQGLRSVTGVLFDMVEKGNRQHAFLSGYLKAKAKGMSEDLAIKEGIKIVHKTQFRYGKLGMAKWSRKPGGKLALQFISYPVKQAQFLYDLYKKDKLAFLRYAAYTIGGNLTLQELFDTDMSNAIGFGISFGEMLKAIQFAAEGDARGAVRHLGQSMTPGGGLLPSGPGPAVSSAISVGQAVRQGKGTEQLVKEITPVMYDRLKQAYKAVKNKEGEEYPIYDSKKHMTYNLSKRQLVQRTVGPRSEKERKESLKFREERNLEQERVEIMKDIAGKFAEGVLNDDEAAIDEAAELINKYGIDIGDKQLENEIDARLTTKEERRKPGKKETYQLLREGEMISDKYSEED